ncbi:hypothetical protein [Clostridium sp. chh4-2]|nr:hypothetical protein [Clostridium sp. chh4-2]
MGAFAASFIGYSIKFIFFIAIAYGGIICGKKYRDHKDANIQK